nr:ORF76 [Ostreid herpesvirus 1]
MFFISRSDTDQATTILYIKMEFKKWHDHECDKGVVVRNLIVGTKVYARKDDGKIPPRDLLSTIGRTKTFICGTCGMRIMDHYSRKGEELNLRIDVTPMKITGCY